MNVVDLRQATAITGIAMRPDGNTAICMPHPQCLLRRVHLSFAGWELDVGDGTLDDCTRAFTRLQYARPTASLEYVCTTNWRPRSPAAAEFSWSLKARTIASVKACGSCGGTTSPQP